MKEYSALFTLFTPSQMFTLGRSFFVLVCLVADLAGRSLPWISQRTVKSRRHDHTNDNFDFPLNSIKSTNKNSIFCIESQERKLITKIDVPDLPKPHGDYLQEQFKEIIYRKDKRI